MLSREEFEADMSMQDDEADGFRSRSKPGIGVLRQSLILPIVEQ